MGTLDIITIGFGLCDTIPAFLSHYGIVPPWVKRVERDCLPLLKIWMEENRMSLLWQRWSLPYFQHELLSDSMPTVCFRVVVEDPQGRRRTCWAAITGRPSCDGEFIARSVVVRLGRPGKAAVSKPKKNVARVGDKSLWDDWVDLG
jgi:hypothetical protein